MEASKLGDKLRLGGLPRPPSCKIGWKQHTGQNGNSKYLKLILKAEGTKKVLRTMQAEVGVKSNSINSRPIDIFVWKGIHIYDSLYTYPKQY